MLSNPSMIQIELPTAQWSPRVSSKKTRWALIPPPPKLQSVAQTEFYSNVWEWNFQSIGKNLINWEFIFLAFEGRGLGWVCQPVGWGWAGLPDAEQSWVEWPEVRNYNIYKQLQSLNPKNQINREAPRPSPSPRNPNLKLLNPRSPIIQFRQQIKKQDRMPAQNPQSKQQTDRSYWYIEGKGRGWASRDENWAWVGYRKYSRIIFGLYNVWQLSYIFIRWVSQGFYLWLIWRGLWETLKTELYTQDHCTPPTSHQPRNSLSRPTSLLSSPGIPKPTLSGPRSLPLTLSKAALIAPSDSISDQFLISYAN